MLNRLKANSPSLVSPSLHSSRAAETAAFGLRMNAGWPFADFQKATGHDLRNGWADTMQELVDQENGVLENERFRLTPKGLRFADAAAAEFLR